MVEPARALTAPRVEAKRRSWLANSPWPFILPSVLYLLFISIYPLISSFALSLEEYNVDQRAFRFVGLENYVSLFHNADFLTSFGNSIIFTVSTVVIELLLGMGLAVFLNRPIRGKGVMRTLLIIPMMTTPMVVGLMWRFLLSTDFGIVDYLLKLLFGLRPINWLGSSPWSFISLIVVDVWEWTPFAFLILYAGLQTIPEDLLEAARTDGAGPLGIFRHISLPLLQPMIAIIVLFRGMDSFRAFDTVFSLTFGGPGRGSATLTFEAYLEGFAYAHLGLASAMSYVILLVIILGATSYRVVVMNRVT